MRIPREEKEFLLLALDALEGLRFIGWTEEQLKLKLSVKNRLKRSITGEVFYEKKLLEKPELCYACQESPTTFCEACEVHKCSRCGCVCTNEPGWAKKR